TGATGVGSLKPTPAGSRLLTMIVAAAIAMEEAPARHAAMTAVRRCCLVIIASLRRQFGLLGLHRLRGQRRRILDAKLDELAVGGAHDDRVVHELLGQAGTVRAARVRVRCRRDGAAAPLLGTCAPQRLRFLGGRGAELAGRGIAGDDLRVGDRRCSVLVGGGLHLGRGDGERDHRRADQRTERDRSLESEHLCFSSEGMRLRPRIARALRANVQAGLRRRLTTPSAASPRPNSAQVSGSGTTLTVRLSTPTKSDVSATPKYSITARPVAPTGCFAIPKVYCVQVSVSVMSPPIWMKSPALVPPVVLPTRM